MAQRLEELDILHTSRHVEACKQLFPTEKSFTTPVGSGVASVTLVAFGRKLNRITGLGMTGETSEEQIVAAEELFRRHGLDAHITLCPLTDPSVLAVLASRGYRIDGFLNTYVRVLTDNDAESVREKRIVIARLPAERVHEFPGLSLAGFKDGGRAEFILANVARCMTLREDTSLYIATVDGKLAGSAGMAFIDTSRGGVAHLYIDSTLPEYRGQGIQGALIRVRLADARKAGFNLASVGARPGTGSCRNIERAGFSLAYTKTWFVKGRD